jgi:hypothetical protein
MDIPTSFILIIIMFDEASKYGDGAKFWGYVGTEAESVCVEFCNFAPCNTFVNYFIFIKCYIFQLAC